jgi:hypothetical protein
MVPQKRANADLSGVVHSRKRLRTASATPGDPAQPPSDYDFNADGSVGSDSDQVITPLPSSVGVS